MSLQLGLHHCFPLHFLFLLCSAEPLRLVILLLGLSSRVRFLSSPVGPTRFGPLYSGSSLSFSSFVQSTWLIFPFFRLQANGSVGRHCGDFVFGCGPFQRCAGQFSVVADRGRLEVLSVEISNSPIMGHLPGHLKRLYLSNSRVGGWP